MRNNKKDVVDRHQSGLQQVLVQRENKVACATPKLKLEPIESFESQAKDLISQEVGSKSTNFSAHETSDYEWEKTQITDEKEQLKSLKKVNAQVKSNTV